LSQLSFAAEPLLPCGAAGRKKWLRHKTGKRRQVAAVHIVRAMTSFERWNLVAEKRLGKNMSGNHRDGLSAISFCPPMFLPNRGATRSGVIDPGVIPNGAS
jgi:hypothetical protein